MSYEKFSSKETEDCSEDSTEVRLVFTQNRSYDLHVGNDVYLFGPYSSKSVPKSVLTHPDFVSVSKNFTIKR